MLKVVSAPAYSTRTSVLGRAGKLVTLLLLTFITFVATPGATAAEDPVHSAGLLDFLKKKPSAVKKTSARRIAVIGDSLAQDLWFGLARRYRKNKNLEFVKFTKSATGLVRDDVYDWNGRLNKFIRSETFDAAVVVMGGNDRQPIRVNGRRLNRRSKAWLKEYRVRVDDLIATLKSETGTVFWVGLPIVRSGTMARDFNQFNKIYASSAKSHRVTFIDIWPLFRGEDGAYTSFGPDLKGAKRTLRKDDGLHFTVAGQNRLAQVVGRAIGRSIKLSYSLPAKKAPHEPRKDQASRFGNTSRVHEGIAARLEPLQTSLGQEHG